MGNYRSSQIAIIVASAALCSSIINQSQRGTGASPSGDPEAGVLPMVWRKSIHEYFPQRFARYCSISSSNLEITCSLKSTEVAHSQQASPRQGIAPTGVWRYLLESLISWLKMKKLGDFSDTLEMAEPGTLMISEEEA
ncbi:hypothetical protein F2Q69_00035275 [Brassica cretica]|uniref:Uncharacterized protein n=1 Tax=Brassica cretica TaxID=69181 RepID=A0A8S9SNV6_BRACR|nr:hypothetical protein F2Q69_00035275 [Brassica cretica]